MSVTTLTFQLLLNGSLVDPAGNSVLLRDAAGAYGVRRADTGGVVVAAGTAMARVSAGLYAYPVTDPAPGLLYQWAAEYAAGGVTRNDPFTTLGTAASNFQGRYVTEADGDDYLGSLGVDVCSDGNGAGVRKPAAVRAAIRAAEARADSRLAGNRQNLAVPLNFGAAAVADIDANFKLQVLAYYAYFLASKLPLTNQQAPGVSFKQQRDDADKFFDDVWYGDAAISGAAVGAAPANVPVAVAATVQADGLTVAAANVRGYRRVWDEALGQWR